MSRIVGTFVNPVVNSVDMDAVIDQIDVDEVVERVDIAKVMDRVDLNHLLEKVDVNELIGRIDLDKLLERLDVDAVVQRLDINAVMEKVDVAELVQRVNVGSVAVNSAGVMALSALDLARRHLAGADAVACYWGRHLARRHPAITAGATGPLTGRPAGPVTRLLGFVLDLVAVAVIFGLGVFLLGYVAGIFAGHPVTLARGQAHWWSSGFGIAMAVLYFWGLVALTGRTFGEAVLGLRVVADDGSILTGRPAFVRVLVFPVSLILFLGLLPIVFGGDRRALHDHAGRATVVYQWGDRPAELPRGVAKWLAERPSDSEAANNVPPPGPVEPVATPPPAGLAPPPVNR